MFNLKDTLAAIQNAIGKPANIIGDADNVMDSVTQHPQMLQVAIPDGMTRADLTADLDKLATKLQPWRRTGTARMSDLDSLIAWANRNKGETSALFATTGDSPALTCIADYFGQGAPVIDAIGRDPMASHMLHRATYAFPLSQEWKIWKAISGKAMNKAEFGEFIEANAKDLLEPTPALLGDYLGDRVLEPWEERMITVAQQLGGRFGQYQQLIGMAREFTVNEVSNLTTTLNRDTGESSIQFLDEHQQADGQPIRVPNLLMIAIPVFDNGAAYRIAVRFRYRKAGQNVNFYLSLHNPDVCMRDAVDEGFEKAVEETGLPLFRGAPEKT
ncbi:DUF2303 family protein [Pararhodobacter sp.]|uniref:DUF2303 family protein n=1 Tax=Pararhodobacter sp. TaxID=2127056 RepID=UPI002FDD59AB